MTDDVTLFLCGDVMTGRGIDQILSRPSAPGIFEPSVRDAREYVRLAEQANGAIQRPVVATYIWGDALAELDRKAPAVRIANLETSITKGDDYERGKGINYRMHPDNLPCLLAARFDICVLANNHVLDFGTSGLLETLVALTAAGVRTTGAGETATQAQEPAVVAISETSRLVVFGFGSATSGIPPWWAAGPRHPGVNLLDRLDRSTAERIVEQVQAIKHPNDIVVASIHWGSNWGYDVPAEHVCFAHWLVDGGVDIVHGHSSHHPRPIERYRNRLILYGCGDFINDYEGITGYEQYRDDLVLMYFVTLARKTAEIVALDMVPLQIRNMRLNRTTFDDSEWLRATLDRVSAPFGCHIETGAGGSLILRGTAAA